MIRSTTCLLGLLFFTMAAAAEERIAGHPTPVVTATEEVKNVTGDQATGLKYQYVALYTWLPNVTTEQSDEIYRGKPSSP